MMATMQQGFLTVISVFLILVPSSYGDLHLTILHTTDISSRFEQVNLEGTECTEADIENGYCLGGMPRICQYVNSTRQERRGDINVLLVDAGDMLIGDFYNVYRGNATAQLMNKCGYDAMTIGNSEIAIGPDALAPFLEMVEFPVVSANLDASGAPRIDGLFTKSAIKNYGEHQVGIVGYGVERINEIANVGDAVFTEVIPALQAEVDALTAQGIEFIVLLGHSWGPGDISSDLEIARSVKGVDILVGGGVNYLHFDGCPPLGEAAETYPIVVTPDHDSEAKVLVVHSPIWGRYLGRLDVMFNDVGAVSEWYGNPVLMDKSIEEDPECLADVKELMEFAEEAKNVTVGRTHVLLEGYPRYSCRMEECSMGNLITNAMVWKWAREYDGSGEGWTNVATAFINSGGIRDSIEQGDITYRDLCNVLPFDNTFDTIELQGKYVLEMLEHSAAGWNESGQFLQMAGMRVAFNVCKDPGERVVEVMIVCTKCEFPQYVPLDENEMYTLAVPAFIAGGYDGYDVVADNAVNRQIGEKDLDVLKEYLDTWSPIYTGLEARITFMSPIVSQTESLMCPGNETTPLPPTMASAGVLTESMETTLMMATTAGATSNIATSAGATSNMATTVLEGTTLGVTANRVTATTVRPNKPRKPRS